MVGQGKPVLLRLGNINFAQDVWDQFSDTVEVLTLNPDTTREDFIKELKNPNGKFAKVSVITRTYHSYLQTGRFDKEIAAALPDSVIAVCHTGAGYDQIDTQYFTERKIQVSHCPNVVNAATADVHVFLLLGALRNFEYGHRNLLAGKWPSSGAGAGAPFGHDPEGKTVGVLGLGGIGRAIVKRLQPFGFKKFIYHNRTRLFPELENGCEYVSFNELLAQSDVISINVPLNANTRHLVNEEAINKMKDGVVLVNTARGAVIDEQAMIKHLKTGKIRSVGLDVFEHEPEVPQELLDMPQVVATPHMGTYCVETLRNMEIHVVDNSKSALKTGKVISLVPEMQSETWVSDCKPIL
ncbi:hypothetical protein Kpol_2000p72 [Vanderwaltozyma polyspora DSM 70294]|uniref:Glyoxylate reductase 1 n=1 Tax=Vanderwaltozyma polyspora (strain ATCC 22028 / DSM 70294 / BCRC 21397 / CBS 2163 / NBRC 10782 / NRRL Y-8283 / UCD 57-17) TaxID=436907 RepID=A7TF79_VANPO|nr:uncharacterized protein Kpol_2000p72 [Vanderwaltozyma polyspora DSM 70294]EDO19104.1 hypothetical protein Kpol_2000p72 [Vanderwaltozyma polyspora DSM 70294]